MTFQHIDTVIAFVAVMLVASLVVTAGTQLIVGLLGLRGANLRRSLADLFEGASEDRDAKRYAKVIAKRVLRQPLVSGSIFSRFGIRADELPFVPADAAGKLRWAGSGIPLQSWLLGAVTGGLLWPPALLLMKRLFASDFCSGASVVTNYIPFLNLCDHPWRSGVILGAIFGGLISRWRLATSIRLDELVAVLEKLSAPAGGTLPDPAQRAMLVIAGETRSRTRPKMSAGSAQIERMFRETDEGDGGVAVAVEKAVAQVATHAETRVEGLNLWFDHAMDRASQRFTAQARLITVLLSVVLVTGVHLDAIHLFQSFSSDGQARAQMMASADALTKQAEQISHGKEGSRSVVPDVYRSAMAAVLGAAPAVAASEPTKSKSHHSSSHSSTSLSSSSAAPGSTTEASVTGETAASTGSPQAPVETETAAAAAPAPPEPSKKERRHKSSSTTENKSAAKDKEKEKEKDKEHAAVPVPVPGEDRVTAQAKLTALKALETRSGFASREDAVLWLRQTLSGDPAVENLADAYEQEVNAQLSGDGDKLIDQSASIKRNLARSEFRLLPEEWPAWRFSQQDLPGLLLAVVFLSLCAPVCYNLLKGVASLRPLRNIR
jgi:hypothetical protein